MAYAGGRRRPLLVWVCGLGVCSSDLAERGCAFLNAAAELPDKSHPARRVVEEFKSRFRERFIALCREARRSEERRVGKGRRAWSTGYARATDRRRPRQGHNSRSAPVK